MRTLSFRFGPRLAHTRESPSVLPVEALIVTFQPNTIRAAGLTQTVPGTGDRAREEGNKAS